MKNTESLDTGKCQGGAPSASKRTLLKSAWVAPVIVAVTLPRSGYGANISGGNGRSSKDSGSHGDDDSDSKPKGNHGNHFGQLKRDS